jgi:hypothetical protein
MATAWKTKSCHPRVVGGGLSPGPTRLDRLTGGGRGVPRRWCGRLRPRSASSHPSSTQTASAHEEQMSYKKQLHMGVAHGLGSGHRPGRSACIGSDVRVLLGSSRCADLPPPARGSVLTLSMESVKASLPVAPLVGSDDAEGRRAASRRCGGRAQSCRWHWSLDRGRSDPCWRHQQGSCGPFSCVSAAIEVRSVGGCGPRVPIVLAHQLYLLLEPSVFFPSPASCTQIFRCADLGSTAE